MYVFVSFINLFVKKLSLPYKALVIGSSGAIGSAFVKALKTDPECAQVIELNRDIYPGFDLTSEQSIEDSLFTIKEQAPYGLIVDATGSLSINGVGPEKSLQALKSAHLDQSFWVNCIGPSIVLKHLVPTLASGRCIYAKLSARVGSITDNKLGGWYSYRSSKAAFNMILHTAAIEHFRKNKDSVFVALQPGTVASPLSSAFVDISKTITPEESVRQMLFAMNQLEAKSGAHFIDYKGAEIDW